LLVRALWRKDLIAAPGVNQPRSAKLTQGREFEQVFAGPTPVARGVFNSVDFGVVVISTYGAASA
jgi:hypothetical protein